MYLSTWYKDLKYGNQLISEAKKTVKEIALVDSYGSMTPLEVYDFFKKIINNNRDIDIGCHFHNNSGLALANTLSAIKAGCKTADSTLKGMGRGAGNAETELLLSLLKSKEINISSYEFDETLEEFQKLKEKLKWGSSFSYSLSAVNGFSQSEMMDLLQKRRLDSSIALTTISSKLKNSNNINFKNLTKISFLQYNTPVLIGGGPSFLDNGKLFLQHLNKDIPIVLSGSNAFKNYLKLGVKIKNKVILLLSGSEIKKIKEIKKSNFLKKYKIDFLVIEKDFYVNNLKKLNHKLVISESIALNPLFLAGKILKQLKVKNMNIAFFDGDFKSEKGRIVMKETQESVKQLIKAIKINSITDTYLNVSKINLWNNDKLLYTN